MQEMYEYPYTNTQYAKQLLTVTKPKPKKNIE